MNDQIDSRENTRYINEVTEDFTVEYSQGKLRITYPMAMWCAGMSRIKAADTGKSENYRYAALNRWIFMSCFDWIREFPHDEMRKIMGGSDCGMRYGTKVLESSGLCVINKEKWARNKGKHAYGQYYEWYPVAVNYDKGSDMVSYTDYDLTGTRFEKMFEYYIDSIGKDSYVPERVDDGKSYPDDIWVPPYWKLEYRYSGSTFRARMYEAYWVAIAVSLMGKNPVYKYRLYTGFHYLPKVLRKNLYFEGSPLVELFDLHCSFYSLSVGLIKEKYPEIDMNALTSFFWDCVRGELYNKCANYLGTGRDDAKEKLQGWRNLYSVGAAHYPSFGYAKVAEFMENNYPEITDIYYKWPTREVKEGVIVKNLQQDLCEYETKIISKLAFELMDEYKCTFFSLHDGLYLSMNEKAKLPTDINEKILNWFKINILT